MNDKIKKTISDKPEVKAEISDWQEKHSPLDENLHVKYDPSAREAKEHLDAILADVNENSQQITEHLEKEYSLKKLALTNMDFLGISGLEDIDLGKDADETTKNKNHREELKRQREMLEHQDNNKGK